MPSGKLKGGYRSEAEYRTAVEQRAREIWEAAEQAMWGDDPKWAKYRQRWEQASYPAMLMTRMKAIGELAREAMGK